MPPRDLIDAGARFDRDWRALTGAGHAGRALIALSGGPDSAALLHLAAARQGWIKPPIAATVDHGIRAESAGEAQVAAAQARVLGLSHTILAGALPARSRATANLSARARDLRYALLRAHATAVGARWIVTAHHADDQLETVVMRLNRGAGVRGLSGIRAIADPIVRPLLGWRRTELAAIVADVPTVADPSNLDPRFDRARLRRELAEAGWLDPVAAARSAAASAQAEDAIVWSVERIAAERVTSDGDTALLDPADLPEELLRRLVERCLAHADPSIAPRGAELTRLVASLREGRVATLGTVRCGVGDRTWRFEPLTVRR